MYSIVGPDFITMSQTTSNNMAWPKLTLNKVAADLEKLTSIVCSCWGRPERKGHWFGWVAALAFWPSSIDTGTRRVCECSQLKRCAHPFIYSFIQSFILNRSLVSQSVRKARQSFSQHRVRFFFPERPSVVPLSTPLSIATPRLRTLPPLPLSLFIPKPIFISNANANARPRRRPCPCPSPAPSCNHPGGAAAAGFLIDDFMNVSIRNLH